MSPMRGMSRDMGVVTRLNRADDTVKAAITRGENCHRYDKRYASDCDKDEFSHCSPTEKFVFT